MTDKSMQFFYGDRELLISVGTVMSSSVDIIVISNDPGLSLADAEGRALIAAADGDMKAEMDQLTRQYGKIEPGMVVYTTAGQLPFEAVVHSVDPSHQDEDGQAILERSISRSLMLCETNGWRSIAFPALGVSQGHIALKTCAQAFFRAISSFWDARHECSVEKINLCLKKEQLPLFFTAFRQDAIDPDGDSTILEQKTSETGEERLGVIDLSEEDVNNNDEEVDSWFK